MGNELLALVIKNLNVPGLISDALKGPLEAALQKLVDDSSTPFDNMAKAALYPMIVAEVEKLAQEQWAKLQPQPQP